MRHKRVLIIVFSVLLALALPLAAQAALVIDGPAAFTGNESGHSSHGIVFSALDWVSLIGFEFYNQGQADQIRLIHNGMPLYTLDTPAGVPIYSASVDWLLEPGSYILVATTSSNGRFAFYDFPATNAHISVTSAFYGGVAGQVNWMNFKNLTTELGEEPGSSSIPEPSTVLLFGSGMFLLFAGDRMRRRRP